MGSCCGVGVVIALLLLLLELRARATCEGGFVRVGLVGGWRGERVSGSPRLDETEEGLDSSRQTCTVLK